MSVKLARPEIVLTHESDLDGLVSGLLLKLLARHLYDVDVPIHTFHNHNWKQRQMTERTAWIADLSCDARCDKPNWLIVDHHQLEHTPKLATLVHDPGKSAGLLCYELCRENGLESDKLARLTHLNNVADLFLVDHPDFVLAGDYANLVKSYQFWNLNSLIEGDLERLLDHPLLAVMRAKREIEDPLGYQWSRNNIISLSPQVGLVNTVIGNTNLIVHRLLEDKTSPHPVMMTLVRRGNGMILASFRSKDGSAIKIAERLQGGGHPNAAGAVLPRSCSRISDAILHLRQILNPKSPHAVPLNTLESLFDTP